jgi:glycosyltransferase involved in cell wall biosynthesis
MKNTLVSVIIPTYDQADFLGEAIQSVLDQSYQNFEIIVVNDASTDDADKVVEQFTDPRLKYIVHERNLRLSETRNTGIKVSKGEIIFLLDSDDVFHSEKLQAHVEFLTKNPEIGVSYNARFELNHSSTTIRELWRPPLSVGLKDLILGFPFSPSDTVIRRDWAFKVGLFNPEIGTAEDTDFPCRLALAGCQFAGIDRALNYRRYHSGRGRKNLTGRYQDVERVIAEIFADPRCPPDIKEMGRMAIKHHLIVIVSLAMIQNETELAQKYVRELIELDPSVLDGKLCELVEFLLSESIVDESVNHEILLKQVFDQFPQELAWLSAQYDLAVARGYLWKGIRAIIWGREEDGRSHIARAVDLHACMDDSTTQLTAYHLLGYEKEFGFDATMKVLSKLVHHLDHVTKRGGNELQASYFVNRAFDDYREGQYKNVPNKVLRAWTIDPGYLLNRGVVSIFVRSIAKAVIR